MDIKKTVRDGYATVARQASGCCDAGKDEWANLVGYEESELEAAPEGSSMGLGCGNPTAIAGLQPGETALDLGSGGGFDCFLAANAVGPDGHVIGVDMTPEMIETARKNAESGGYANVEFRLGDIEQLPVEDAGVDVVISNCVINLAEDKGLVFAEACRVLKPGGRLHVSDIVFLQEPPECLLESAAAYVGCVSGALRREEYLGAIKQAGFEAVTVEREHDAAALLSACADTIVGETSEGCCCGADLELPENLVASLTISAQKPR